MTMLTTATAHSRTVWDRTEYSAEHLAALTPMARRWHNAYRADLLNLAHTEALAYAVSAK